MEIDMHKIGNPTNLGGGVGFLNLTKDKVVL